MKKFLAVLALVATGPIIDPPVSHAAEAGVSCRTAERVADAGYGFQVSRDFQRAVLSEQTFMGPRKVADMKCKQLPGQNYPDALNNYLVCRDVNAIDGGLIVRVYAGGIAGIHEASVRSFSVLRGRVVENEVQFGRLNCRR